MSFDVLMKWLGTGLILCLPFVLWWLTRNSPGNQQDNALSMMHDVKALIEKGDKNKARRLLGEMKHSFPDANIVKEYSSRERKGDTGDAVLLLTVTSILNEDSDSCQETAQACESDSSVTDTSSFY